MKKLLAGIGIGIIGIVSIGCGNEIIEQPAIQTGQQAVITCEGHNDKGNGIIHLDGIAQGETVTIKWASPVIGQSDMTKTLYCLNGSPRVGATSY